MTLTGTNLNMPGYYSCEMTHFGVKADSCVLDGAGNAIGTWSLGVPLSRVAETPSLTINIVD